MYGAPTAYVPDGYAPAPSGWPAAAPASPAAATGGTPAGSAAFLGRRGGGGPPGAARPGASAAAPVTGGAAAAAMPFSGAAPSAAAADHLYVQHHHHHRPPLSPTAAAARGSPQHEQQSSPMGNAAATSPAAAMSPLPPPPPGYAAVPAAAAGGPAAAGGGPPPGYGSSSSAYRRSLLGPPSGQPPQQQQVVGASGGGTSRRAGGRCFLLAVLLLIAFLYVGYVFGLLLPMLLPLPSPGGLLLFLVFHCCFLLLLCAFFKAVFTDPGRVPANWGFYMGDENKRRRYCKVCDVWKPDRTHHCSACGRCVLNMDHHCPWINNCVGFYNRKYFIQLLVYALISLFLIFAHGFYFIFMESLRTGAQLQYGRPPRPYAADAAGGETDLLQQHAPWSVLRYVYVCLVLFVSMILIFALIPFSRFHMNLVLRNSTTIENMDVANRDRNRYDLGVGRNVEQVFGANPCCWLIPLQSAATRPVGDGVRWSMHYMVANDDQV